MTNICRYLEIPTKLEIHGRMDSDWLQAMMAWGNQSCGRLGLQEKRMEKAMWGSTCSIRDCKPQEALAGFYSL